jgi:hypothetical protein
MRELSQGARQLIVLAVVISALDRIASHDCCFSVTKPSQKLPTKFSNSVHSGVMLQHRPKFRVCAARVVVRRIVGIVSTIATPAR